MPDDLYEGSTRIIIHAVLACVKERLVYIIWHISVSHFTFSDNVMLFLLTLLWIRMCLRLESLE